MSPSFRPVSPPRLCLAALAAALLVGAPGCSRQPDHPEQPGQQAQANPTTLPDVAPLLKVGVDQPMPAWELVTLDGERLKSEDLLGKVVVLDIWATWCAPCVHEMPGYEAMRKKYEDQGFVVVGASVDRAGPEAVKRFVERHKIGYPIGLASYELLDALVKDDGIPLPLTFLIDREGVLRHAKAGAMEVQDYEKLVEARL